MVLSTVFLHAVLSKRLPSVTLLSFFRRGAAGEPRLWTAGAVGRSPGPVREGQGLGRSTPALFGKVTCTETGTGFGPAAVRRCG